MSARPVRFQLNGRPVDVITQPHRTLLQLLREDVGAVDVKYGCGEGVCGTCTVLLDGESVSSCTVLAVQAEGRRVTTLAGLPENDGPHAVQKAFVEHGASQCGFCTPGMVLAAYELVREHPDTDREGIRGALSGNLCRCTGYTKIVDAVEAYARGLRDA